MQLTCIVDIGLVLNKPSVCEKKLLNLSTEQLEANYSQVSAYLWALHAVSTQNSIEFVLKLKYFKQIP